ncbi:hypothetical protein JOF53_003873 [Crossiella equi]|uniref:Ferric siderophore reductase C-terminal domain-containing protein n=1 Tax=Crossiella equi TaxID=130796 RepID=A0ABS5AEI2_9PSEU|nr:hypothetical protein [Crossiella equi]MBP2475001.1 hypothetical protein [Crossiella equi]
MASAHDRVTAACPEIRISAAEPPPDALHCPTTATSPEVARSLVEAELAVTPHRVVAAAARTAMSVYAIKVSQAVVLPWALGLGHWPLDRVHLAGDGGHGWHTMHLLGEPVPAALPEVLAELLDRHLVPLAAHLRSYRGCGEPTMRGQIGFGMGTALSRASKAGLPDGPLVTAWEALCAAVPWLSRTGRLLPGARGLTFLREYCCLYWTAPEETECRSCPRRTDQDRLAR